jgi:hypothetical protein
MPLRKSEETSSISHVSALMAVFVGYSSKKKLVYITSRHYKS